MTTEIMKLNLVSSDIQKEILFPFLIWFTHPHTHTNAQFLLPFIFLLKKFGENVGRIWEIIFFLLPQTIQRT